VREYVDVVHSLDRESLVDALGAPSSDSEPRPVSAFVQVNLTDDPNRGGMMPEQLESFIERVLAVPSITLLGLMAVAPLDESARRAFATVRALSQRVTSIAPHATGLSMGMSGDYRDAILEGATHLRIGTAITGN